MAYENLVVISDLLTKLYRCYKKQEDNLLAKGKDGRIEPGGKNCRRGGQGGGPGQISLLNWVLYSSRYLPPFASSSSCVPDSMICP